MSHAARLLERDRAKEALSFLALRRPRLLPAALRAEWNEMEGRALQALGDFRRSRLRYLRARRFAGSADRWRRAELALKLGDTARQLENFVDALRWYRVAAQEARSIRSGRLALDSATGRAMALRGLGRYREAIRAFQSLLTDYRRDDDQEGMAYTLWALGTTERFAGRLREAERHLRRAVSLYRSLGDASGLAYARCGWGGTLRMIGRASASRRQYSLAHQTFLRRHDAFGVAYSACGQANAWRMAGKRERALPLMDRAEKGYRALRLDGPLGFVLWSRAQVYIESGDLAQARRQLEKARRAFLKARDPRGAVYVDLGRAELARRARRSARGLYRKAESAAARLGLMLEKIHARVRSGRSPMSAYRPLGVSISHFSRYRSLP